MVDLTLGTQEREIEIWERLDKAIELILYGNISKESADFFDACDDAILKAGIDKEWVKAGYDNVDELLYGRLGPIP